MKFKQYALLGLVMILAVASSILIANKVQDNLDAKKG
jgi:hypothetical protein